MITSSSCACFKGARDPWAWAPTSSQRAARSAPSQMVFWHWVPGANQTPLPLSPTPRTLLPTFLPSNTPPALRVSPQGLLAQHCPLQGHSGWLTLEDVEDEGQHRPTERGTGHVEPGVPKADTQWVLDQLSAVVVQVPGCHNAPCNQTVAPWRGVDTGIGLHYWGPGLPFGDGAAPLEGGLPTLQGHCPSTCTLAHPPGPLSFQMVPWPHSQAQTSFLDLLIPLASRLAISSLWQPESPH